MTRRNMIALFTAACGAALGGCSVLTAFSTFTPRDPAKHEGRGIAYGPDPRQKLDVYAPEQGGSNLPVVMFYYGGGWNSGSRTDYGWAAQSLAAKGYLVVVPDYRLVPQAVYPAIVQDTAAAVRWAQDNAARYGGDPTRIVLTGHSAGAYFALQLALDDDFLKQAGVDYSHIRGAVGLSGPYDYYPDIPVSRNAFGGFPDVHATQPLAYAARPHRPPVLLIQGDNDKLVGVRNSVLLDKALKAAGNPSTLHVYPGLTHPDTVLALSVPFRNKAPILDEVTAFINKVTIAG